MLPSIIEKFIICICHYCLFTSLIQSSISFQIFEFLFYYNLCTYSLDNSCNSRHLHCSLCCCIHRDPKKDLRDILVSYSLFCIQTLLTLPGSLQSLIQLNVFGRSLVTTLKETFLAGSVPVPTLAEVPVVFTATLNTFLKKTQIDLTYFYIISYP